MSVPFENNESANAAIAAFFEDVRTAREKHRISDVIVIVEAGMISSDGEEVRGSATSSLGAASNKLPMLAREYGAARQEHEEIIASIVARSRRAK